MSTTETVPPQLGQAVALAQRALIPARDAVLDEAGARFDTYAALNMVASGDPAISVDELRRGLAAALETEPVAASQTIERLESEGLIEFGDDHCQLRLTAGGEARFERLRESMQQLTR